MSTANVVWLPPSATTFSCLCETCLETARCRGLLFADALAAARVSGTLDPAAGLTVARCAAGHELVLRRVERPGTLPRRDGRQLELV